MTKKRKPVFRRPIRIFEYLDTIDAPPEMYERMGRLVMLDLTKREKDARKVAKLEKELQGEREKSGARR